MNELPRGEAGQTILELLVATTLGLLVTGLMVSTTMAAQRLYQTDLVNTRIEQNLRGALDMIGMNAREAGENLPGVFPAVETLDGGGDSDELVLRRSLLDEVLTLCTPITAGSNDSTIYFATGAGVAGCDYVAQLNNYNAWRAHRLAAAGPVKAYIYDLVTGVGEFFEYTGETDTGSLLAITRAAGSWGNNYNVGSGIYLLEEWRFRRFDSEATPDLLQLIENENDGNPQNVSFSIRDLQARVLMSDGTAIDNYVPSSATPWTAIAAIEVTLTGVETYRGQDRTKTLSGRYFPRNILSH